MSAIPLGSIEVAFAVPVVLTRAQEIRLYELVDEIARANAPVGHVHWLSGMGAKPTYPQADARFLGKSAGAAAPEAGEPTFDTSVFYLETFCRERYEDEPRHTPSERASGDTP